MKQLSKSWDRVDNALSSRNKYLFYPLFFLIILLLLVASGITITMAINLGEKIFSGEKVEQKNDAKTKSSIKKEETNREVLGSETVSSCSNLEWHSFKDSDWLGKSYFSISNGVWTLPFEKQNKDAVLYSNISCRGSTQVEYEVIPRLEEFINLNLYVRGQFRWEIGGNDRRSIRLYKNVYGCESGEIKNVIEIKLKSNFLADHDEILINHPLLIYNSTYSLPNGLIRTEVSLKYASKNNNGEIVTTDKNLYYYDFNVGLECSEFHLPDINVNAYQYGLGLQKNSIYKSQDTSQPRVSFEKYRVFELID